MEEAGNYFSLMLLRFPLPLFYFIAVVCPVLLRVGSCSGTVSKYHLCARHSADQRYREKRLALALEELWKTFLRRTQDAGQKAGLDLRM